MRFRSAAAPSLVLVAAAAALAQDAPPGPAAGESGGAPAAPARDAAALEALERLAKLVPTPGSAGVREVRCAVRPLDPPFPVLLRARWGSDGRPTVAVDLPVGMLKKDAAPQAEALFRGRVLTALLLRSAWDPANVAQCDVSSERRGDSLVVTLRDRTQNAGGAVLTIGADGLPTALESAGPGAGRRPFRFAFEKQGDRQLLTRVEAGDPPAPGVHLILAYHDVGLPFAMPRRIEWQTQGGKTDAYVFHDLVVDGNLVPGTSEGEAMAGRRRTLDARSAAWLAQFDRAVATPYGAGVRTLAARIEYEPPSSRTVFHATWRPEGVTSCEVESATAGDAPANPQFTAGARLGFALASSGLLRPASSEFAAFDIAAESSEDPKAPPVFVLTPLDASAQYARIRLRIDADGLVVGAAFEPRDGGPTVTSERKWVAAGGGRVLAEEVLTRGAERTTTRNTYYDAKGFPPLLRTVERVQETADGPKTWLRTHTDWVVDGTPVPGTGSAAATGDGK